MNIDMADTVYRLGSLASGAASGMAASAASSWSMILFGVPLAVIFAAFSGAMVSLSFLPSATFGRTLTIIASGTVAGAYTSALVAEWLGFTPAATGGAAFIVGGCLQWAIPTFIERLRNKP